MPADYQSVYNYEQPVWRLSLPGTLHVGNPRSLSTVWSIRCKTTLEVTQSLLESANDDYCESCQVFSVLTKVADHSCRTDVSDERQPSIDLDDQDSGTSSPRRLRLVKLSYVARLTDMMLAGLLFPVMVWR